MSAAALTVPELLELLELLELPELLELLEVLELELCELLLELLEALELLEPVELLELLEVLELPALLLELGATALAVAVPELSVPDPHADTTNTRAESPTQEILAVGMIAALRGCCLVSATYSPDNMSRNGDRPTRSLVWRNSKPLEST